MSRHRDVRNLDYDEEYDEAYDEDVYGHSVDDDEFGISPTMDQYMYNSRSRDANLGFGAYLPTDTDIQEEEEGTATDLTDSRTRHDSATYEKPKLSDEDEVRLSSVLDELRNILGGEQFSDSEMTQMALANKFDLNDTLNALLNKQPDGEATKEAPATAAVLPQRQQRQNKDGSVNYIVDSVGVKNCPRHIRQQSNKNLKLGEGSRVAYFHPPAFTAASVCIFQDGKCERLPLHRFVNEWYDDLMSKRKQKAKNEEEQLKKEAECNKFIKESAIREALKKERSWYENNLSDSQETTLATSQEEDTQDSQDGQEIFQNINLETKSQTKWPNSNESETGMEALRNESSLKSLNSSLDGSLPLALSHISSQEKVQKLLYKPGDNSLNSLTTSNLFRTNNDSSLTSQVGGSNLVSLPAKHSVQNSNPNVAPPLGLSALSSLASSHFEMTSSFSSGSSSSGLNLPSLPSSLGQVDQPMFSSSPRRLNLPSFPTSSDSIPTAAGLNIPAFPESNTSSALNILPLTSNNNTSGINIPQLSTRQSSSVMNIPPLSGSGSSSGFNIPAFPGSNSPSGFNIPAFPDISKGDSKSHLGSFGNKSDSSSVGGSFSNSPSGLTIPPFPTNKPLSVEGGSQEPWELPECQNAIASCSMALTKTQNIDPIGTPAHHTSMLMSSSGSGLESYKINALSSLAKNHFGSMLDDVSSVPSYTSIPSLQNQSSKQQSSDTGFGLSSLANLHLTNHALSEVEMKDDMEAAEEDDLFSSIEMEEIDLQLALRKPGSLPVKVKRNSPIFTDMDEMEHFQFPYEDTLCQPTPKSVFGEVMLKVMGKIHKRPKTRKLSKRTITVNFPIFKFDRPSPDDLVRAALKNKDNPNWYKLITRERQKNK